MALLKKEAKGKGPNSTFASNRTPTFVNPALNN